MLKKTGFVERRVHGLANTKDYVTMFKKEGLTVWGGHPLGLEAEIQGITPPGLNPYYVIQD